MKFFRKSSSAIGAPSKIGGLKPRVRYRLNVYDPADPFAFLASPVFFDAEDMEFKTSSSVRGAHGAYFRRLDFYDRVRERLETAFR